MRKLFRIILVTLLCFGGLFFNTASEVEAVAIGDSFGKCPNCGSSYYYIVRIAREPTCTEAGSGAAACQACGATNVVSFAATGHIYVSKITKEPTCTVAGTKTLVCSVCSDRREETVAALGHSYVKQVTKAATCTEKGTLTSTCSRCNATKTETIAALGHNYVDKITAAATCTQQGIAVSTCTRCRHSFTKEIAAFGHIFVTTVTKEATCQEDGLQVTECQRCVEHQEEVIPALGHDYEYTVVEPTCTVEGTKTGICTRCNEESVEKLAALGHDFGESVVMKTPTCTQTGISRKTCSRCSEIEESVIAANGHTFPEVWTLEKEPTYTAEGLEVRRCKICGERVTRPVDKKSLLPIILAVTGVIAVSTGIFLVIRFRRHKIAEIPAEEPIETIKPKIETKTIVIDSKDEKLIGALKNRSYLKIKAAPYEELKEAVSDNEPNLVICSIETAEQLDEIIGYLEEDWKEVTVGLLAEQSIIDEKKDVLEKLKEEKKVNYLPLGSDDRKVMTNMILPILKPELSSDETLENFGMIADVLGFGDIATLIDYYITGRDLKLTLEEGDLGLSGTATVVGDIAYIMGFEQVSSIAGLVDDLEKVKSALDKEAGAHEVKKGISGAKDMVEVVSDIVNGD